MWLLILLSKGVARYIRIMLLQEQSLASRSIRAVVPTLIVLEFMPTRRSGPVLESNALAVANVPT